MTVLDCDVSGIYNALQDGISKHIFEHYLMWNLTGDHKFLKSVVRTNDIVRKTLDIIETTNRPVGIFGAGSIGGHIGKMYPEKVVAYIDNKKTGEKDGKQIEKLDSFLHKYPNSIIVVATKYYKEIDRQLEESNILQDMIIDIGKIYYEDMEGLQYFDLPNLWENLHDNEVFVDGGAYDGKSTVGFFDMIDKHKQRCSEFVTYDDLYGYSYLWEPDKENVDRIKKSLARYDARKYRIIEKGLWSNEGEMSFSEEGTTSSHIIEKDGAGIIKVGNIDKECKKAPTFIKMDVEGAEKMALIGARKTIEKNHPKLAICLYHRKEDLIEIPKLIIEMFPEYRFYMRHYSFTAGELVLYAL